MPSTLLACPEENELLALAMGEPAAAEVIAHVVDCTSCKATLERLRAEVALLRQNHVDGTTPPSTEPDPTADPGGEPSSAGTTQDWKSAEPAGTTDADQLGPEAVAAARNRAEGQAYVSRRNRQVQGRRLARRRRRGGRLPGRSHQAGQRPGAQAEPPTGSCR